MHEPGMKNQGVIQDEEEVELAWAESRPTSMASHWNQDAEGECLLRPGKWECALNVMESGFLHQYRRAWPGSAYQLNQDPGSGHGHHTTSDKRLFTLISNLGLVRCWEGSRLTGTVMINQRARPNGIGWLCKTIYNI